jgi:hypothetical protein
MADLQEGAAPGEEKHRPLDAELAGKSWLRESIQQSMKLF